MHSLHIFVFISRQLVRPDIKWDRVQIFEPILISRLQAHREFKTFKYSNTCNSRHLTLIVIIRFVVIIIILWSAAWKGHIGVSVGEIEKIVSCVQPSYTRDTYNNVL